MKRRPPWRLSSFGIIAASLVLVCAGTGSVRAQTPPPWTITVSGQPVTLTDIVHAMATGWGTGSAQRVPKDRKQMPAFAPYVWYAGRDAEGKATVWIAGPEVRKTSPDALRAEVRRENTAAGILLALDQGGGGPTWQRLYHALPDDPRARNAFAVETIDAFKAASAWTVAKMTADRHWIFANLQAGLTRQQVYALLDTRGLSATDESERTTKPPAGLAYVTLPGYFEPGCSFTHRITITFDATDRVKKLDLNPPHPNCV